MTLDEFIKQLSENKNYQYDNTMLGNENLNINAYTKPTLGGNLNAYQQTPVGLLSSTIGKEVSQPSYKDIALTNDNLRAGLLSQSGNTAPYGEYSNPNIFARIMGGNNPNANINYTQPLENGRFSAGANYSNQGLGVNAEYEKQLKEWLLRAGLNANPYEKQIGITLGREF